MALIDSTIIIADDLTGANDTALQYFNCGRSTKIIIDDKQDFIQDDDVDVWAISTESRNIDKKEAFDRVLDICEKLKPLNVENYYKKIDSTLRGNTGLEILAVLEKTQKDAAIIAPAFVEEKRITIGGYQLLDGAPIERTQCALDPKAPIFESYIPDILKKDFNSQLKDLIATIEFKTISKGAGPITLKINELINNGKKLIILDAISNTDLEQIALAINKSSYNILPVGSAGLANAINKQNDYQENKNKNIVHIPDLATLVISGSATQLSAKQIQKLKEEQENIFFVDLEVKNIIEGLNQNLIDEICNKLNAKIDVVVHTSYITQEILEEQAQNQLIDAGIAKDELPNKITDYLAEFLGEINRNSHFLLVMMGGETSYKCAKIISSKYFQVLDAIMPAIPLCLDANGQIIVTKSGNFGNSDTLVNILKYFEDLKA